MIGDMHEVLRAAKSQIDEFWPDCRWVFHRIGSRLRHFKEAWDSACKRAGFPGLHFHDLRRSGARNLSRAGVPERVIMEITGHKTRAMFDRYNIVSEADLSEAAGRLEKYRAERAGDSSNVISTDTISDTEAQNGNGD
jgi:integrase